MTRSILPLRLWTPEDDDLLLTLRAAGTPLNELAQRFSRTRRAIEIRLTFLGAPKPGTRQAPADEQPPASCADEPHATLIRRWQAAVTAPEARP